jgi:hypothetical protein
MVTAESILRALKNIGVGLDKLGVEYAKVKADEFQGERCGILARGLFEEIG